MEEYQDDGSELDQLIEQQEMELEMAQMQAEIERQQQVEIKLLRNKLRKIYRDIGVSRTSLRENEKKVVKQAKKYPNLKKEITMINAMLMANKAKNTSKMISSSPALFYIAIGILLIFLILSVVSAVGSAVGGNGGNPSSQFGITGADFYGARMVYVDDEKATQNMVEDYVEIVEKSIKEIEETNSLTVSGGSYTFNANVNVTLPTDYDYSTYDETAFSSQYVDLYSIVFDLSKIVYLEDNGVNYSGTSLTECLNGVKYFGFANRNEFNSKLLTSIGGKISVENVSPSADSTVINEIVNALKTQLENKLNSTDYSNLFLRTEKFFVKDYILNEDTERISDVEKENYVAMIFMPKKEVSFKKFSFVVSAEDLTNFNMLMKINGTEVNVSTDNNNISLTEGQISYMYFTSEVNYTVGVFDGIDTNNLSGLAEETSLFDIMQNSELDYAAYLQNSVDENSVEVWSYKQAGAVVEMGNTQKFSVVEFETSWD